MMFIILILQLVQVICCFRLKQARTLTSKMTLRMSQSLESELSNLLNSNTMSGRGAKSSIENLAAIDDVVLKLENSKSRIKNPVSSEVLDGCWKLLYTSSPGTNSPIQRTFTALDSVSIYQVVNLKNRVNSYLKNNLPDISNVVCFGDKARLRVTALASTIDEPLIEPRKGDGKILGFNIFGVSSSDPPRDVKERIDFSFQEACFEFSNSPFSIPYPVPFKLLGDEAKGWIDVTYLSSKYRIARGNKGTVFVLEKINPSSSISAALATTTNIKDFNPVQPPLNPIKSTKKDSKPTNNLFNFFKPAVKSDKPSVKTRTVGIIFPAQLSTAEDYETLIQSLRVQTAGKFEAFAVPLSRMDWPVGLIPSFFSMNYFQGTLKPSETLQFYFKKVDELVLKLLKEAEENNENIKFSILGHSIGGWVARAYISEWCDKSIKTRISSLTTLGTPHSPPPDNSLLKDFDQTRGLLSHINTNYPGAFESNIEYHSVIGSEIEGKLNFLDIQSFLAFFSYIFLLGEGNTTGDGIIPVATAYLPGAKESIVEGVRHSNFVPTPVKSIVLENVIWYGSEEIVQKWLPVIKL